MVMIDKRPEFNEGIKQSWTQTRDIAVHDWRPNSLANFCYVLHFPIEDQAIYVHNCGNSIDATHHCVGFSMAETALWKLMLRKYAVKSYCVLFTAAFFYYPVQPMNI